MHTFSSVSMCPVFTWPFGGYVWLNIAIIDYLHLFVSASLHCSLFAIARKHYTAVLHDGFA